MILIEAIAVLLLITSGPFLLALLSRRLKVRLGRLEVIVFGFILWMFVVIAGAYIVGITSYYISSFFSAITIIGLAITCLGVYSVIPRVALRTRWHLSWDKTVLLALALSILVIISLLTFLHTIYSEYDPIFYYLPFAKSIVETGGLQFNVLAQDGISTTYSPVLPLVFAYVWHFSSTQPDFESAVRTVPLLTVLFSALLVYMCSQELSLSKEAAMISAVAFVCMPVLSAVAADYSLYLDLPFIFFLFAGALATFKLLNNFNSSFWWTMAGISFSLMVLSNDLGFFILPSVAAILISLVFISSNRTVRLLQVIFFACLFGSTYAFFFGSDLMGKPAGLLSELLYRQAPVLVVMPIFAVLLFFRGVQIRIPAKKMRLVWGVFPFGLVGIYLLRNIVEFGAVSRNYPFLFNADAKTVLAITTRITGGATNLPVNLLEGFRWDTLFTSVLLGAIFALPILFGIVSLAKRYSQGSSQRPYIALSFLLLLLALWSWEFNADFTGSMLRNLLYFAPLLACFVGEGISSASRSLHLTDTLKRFALFCSLSTGYFWLVMAHIGSSSISALQTVFTNSGIVSFQTWAVFALFFVISFFPIHIDGHRRQKWFRNISVLGLLLLCVSTFFVGVLPSALAGNYQPASATSVYPGWENNLAEVLGYLNHVTSNNLSVIGCYTMEISYFTNHPEIDAYTTNGLMDLLPFRTQSPPQLANALSSTGIGYVLLPNPAESQYAYCTNLAQFFNVLNGSYLARSPDFLHLEAFSDFTLYRVLPDSQVNDSYLYLTQFSRGWSPLGNYSLVESNEGGGVLIGSKSIGTLSLSNGDVSSLWLAEGASEADVITATLDSKNPIDGQSSLKVFVNGTGNMVIDRTFSQSLNLADYNTLTFDLYGANTSSPIELTFHSSPWKDYFYADVMDNFTGWKAVSLSLSSFKTIGQPSWGNISFAEILAPDRTATYHMGPLTFSGRPVGLRGSISLPDGIPSNVTLVLSVQGGQLPEASTLDITSDSGSSQIVLPLKAGVNQLTIPGGFTKSGITLEISYPQVSTAEKLVLYYLGLTNPT